PLLARKIASRRVRSADSAKVLRRSPHTVIVRSPMTPAISSRTAPMVHSLTEVTGSRPSSGRADLDTQEVQGVVSHDLSNIGLAESLQLLNKRHRRFEALPVRPVGTEQNLVDTDDFGQLR